MKPHYKHNDTPIKMRKNERYKDCNQIYITCFLPKTVGAFINSINIPAC